MSALEPTPRQLEVVQRIAKQVVRFGVVVPAVLALESMRPLSFVGSQFMHMLTPSLGAVLSSHDWEVLAGLLEHREGLDVLLVEIERMDEESGSS